MNDFLYDSVKTNEMDLFLKKIHKIAQANNNYIDKNIISNELRFSGLKQEDYDEYGIGINKEELFEKWEKDFSNYSDINVFVFPKYSSFCQFLSIPELPRQKEYIKLYIPIDSNHLFYSAEYLFGFLERIGVKHKSKISKHIRSDNIIIRLEKDNYNAAKDIIDYINKTPYLKEALNNTNPFVPTINGIGFMIESGISYNSKISGLISEYTNNNILLNKEPSIEDFKSWFNNNVQKYDPYNYKELIRIFETSININNRDVIPKTNKYSQMNLYEKNSLFNAALNSTYEKYGLKQSYLAIKNLVDQNNYNGFTNGNQNTINYRDELKNNVSSMEIRGFIESSLNAINQNNNDDMDNKIRKYINYVFENNMPYELNKICLNTSKKYGQKHLSKALMSFYLNNNIKKFSKYSDDKSINYRKKLAQFDKKSFVKSMIRSLNIKGIIIGENTNIDTLIEMYSKSISDTLNNENVVSQKRN